MSLKASDGIFTVRGGNAKVLSFEFFNVCSRSDISWSNLNTVPFRMRLTVLFVVLCLIVTDKMRMPITQYEAYCKECTYFCLETAKRLTSAEHKGAFCSAFLNMAPDR